jgi:3-hydroxybutyryl-CoA dehydrogenase
MTADLDQVTVLVAGAGIMGSGIAQLAAQAGHRVLLFDVTPGVAVTAKARLAEIFARLTVKGKFSETAAAQTLSRIEPIDDLEGATTVGLVVEAVVEDIDIKRSLMQQLEAILAADCVLATNTSSLSVTAIGRGMQHPERLVGMHFFNPVALMKLVEVVSGLQTSSVVAEAIFVLAKSWGKIPVHARSTPGFIVNRIARPFYAETLALLGEQAMTAEIADCCLRAAGFRMGPCELMDLIGQDTNLAVTRAVYEANYFDKRYVPSRVQQELVDAGLLGRKSGRGFYDYNAQHPPATPALNTPQAAPSFKKLAVRGQGPIATCIAERLHQQGCKFERIEDSKWIGLQVDGAKLRLTDGRSATELGREVAVFDLALARETGVALAWSISTRASSGWSNTAPAWLMLLGFAPQQIADVPGLIVARTIAMLINEAADAVHQGVCDEAGADTAMKLGVNYPAGPFEWLRDWNTRAVIRLLERLDAYYRGERYRVSPWLRQRAYRKPAPKAD